MQKLRVNLGINSYDIIFERGLIKEVGKYINRNSKKVFVLTDDNVGAIYGDGVVNSLRQNGYDAVLFTLPHGEKTKAFCNLEVVYRQLNEFCITRKDLIITLGGGVIGDLGGFVASTYLRGIDFIQIPTSLLAQVDSSIGGKVAVDLPWGKNLAGAFYQPKAVLIDPEVLKTLPEEFFVDGMAEVIKYGCIKDKQLFDLLNGFENKQQLMQNIDKILYTCCDIKRVVVENDERDLGERMLLNFGHTYGHALEKYYNFEKLSHGMAVAIGMYEIVKISEQKGLLKECLSEKIKDICTKYGLPTTDEAPKKEVIGAIRADKKNLGDKLVVVLLKQIGESYLYPTNLSFFE